MTKTLSTLAIIYALILIVIFNNSCANMIPPTGGPKDSIPPILLGAVPKDSTLNFTGKVITLHFNEYVTLDNVQQNVVISPNPSKQPSIESKLKTVTIKLRDSLEPNVTYSINFGNSIRDVNEGNIAKEFTYLYSTGNYLDSNSFGGRVIMAETGKTDSTLVVVLHSNLADSAIKKLPPRYYTKINSKGYFAFNYLPAGKFALYVVPNDYSRKYDDSTKMFAFLDHPVEVGKPIDSLVLYAYQEAKEIPKAPKAPVMNRRDREKAEEDKRLKITPSLKGEQDLLDDLRYTVNRKIKHLDSSKFILYDTLFNRIQGAPPAITMDTTLTEITVKYQWPENTHYKLVIEKEAVTDSSDVALWKNDTLSFATKKENEYGSLLLRFPDVDLGKHNVLILLQGEKIFRSIPITKKDWYQRLFPPGEYDMRILDDRNNNGVWDPGHFWGEEKRQPETVISIGKKLNVRANWNNEADIMTQPFKKE